ncbi:GntR family transcriptional regulator [Arthrobacter roseus]|uniref:GntR family transcriptional regulator n=1 Tax=Arthrobacter roseus TaxID=136274 RepID=UPI001963040D|nr:GntR family transcriptional regulator [Arthrobacter roseus]MBM7846910.1 GntR family transcriptional regulator [Arthrobacter roseus]
MALPVSAAPKYYVLKEELRLLVGESEPGAPLPPERALAVRYATSRTTVRQAIAELVAEGVLNRTQGKGTFIAAPHPTYVRQLTSFSEDAVVQNLESSSRIVSVDSVPADALQATQLDVSPGSLLTRVERVRLINGEPLAHEIAHIPGDLPHIRERLDEYGSLYSTLSRCYSIEIAVAEDTVATRVAGPDEARLLEIEVGAPLLMIHRLGLDADSRPVEWTKSVFRGDRFHYFARMDRTSE